MGLSQCRLDPRPAQPTRTQQTNRAAFGRAADSEQLFWGRHGRSGGASRLPLGYACAWAVRPRGMELSRRLPPTRTVHEERRGVRRGGVALHGERASREAAHDGHAKGEAAPFGTSCSCSCGEWTQSARRHSRTMIHMRRLGRPRPGRARGRRACCSAAAQCEARARGGANMPQV